MTWAWFKELTIDIALTLTIGATIYCAMVLTDTTPEDIFNWVYDHTPSFSLTTERPKYM